MLQGVKGYRFHLDTAAIIMQRTQPILLVGYGYLGRRLVKHCVAVGRPVCVLTRSSAHQGELEALGVEYQILDLDTDSGSLTIPVADKVILYTAPPAGPGTDPRLLSLLGRLGERPAKLVYISTSGVYGDCQGDRVDENTPVNPGSERARRRVAAERAVSEWAEDKQIPWTVLRVPGIYGPERLPLAALANGDAFLRPEDAGPGNRIHVDDLLECCLAAADNPRASGVFNVSDGDPLSATGFAQATARATGLKAPRLVSRSEAPQVIGPGRWSFLSESRLLDVRRMQEELAPAMRYSNPLDGLAASLKEMGIQVLDDPQG